MSTPLKQIHLAAHFPGVNNTTVWSDPEAGSHIEFSSFAHFARTAERAKFDFLFLAEGLRLREQEFVWNRDLSPYDPDGPLPDIDPDLGEHTIARGRAQVRMYRDPLATAREWRELAAANKWSIRDLVIETGNRRNFVGSPATVAETINDFVQTDASDGFILVPHITPGGLDPFADQVVPLLQESGVYRTEYTGTTLRDHLGLAHPDEVRDERAAS
ncbi:hypothetical protein ABT010_28830 [Streptomyces sp. NPDC002668]|uniref:hypothetical protein n=1 Tax=Streptomyces sp. NPDC002668 TaxID=3154422 RepID=UPI003325B77D